MKKHEHPLKDAMGRMSVEEIFKNSKELNRDAKEGDWKKAYEKAQALSQTKEFRVMRCGNSLFLYKIMGPSTAHMFIVNADSPKNFFKNLEQFVLAMKQANFKQVSGVTDDLPTVKIIQKLGIKHGYKTTIEETGLHAVQHQTYKVVVNV